MNTITSYYTDLWHTSSFFSFLMINVAVIGLVCLIWAAKTYWDDKHDDIWHTMLGTGCAFLLVALVLSLMASSNVDNYQIRKRLSAWGHVQKHPSIDTKDDGNQHVEFTDRVCLVKKFEGEWYVYKGSCQFKQIEIPAMEPTVVPK